MFRNGPWLGQVPLILGPSSFGTGMAPQSVAAQFAGAMQVVDGRLVPYDPVGVPPYWGEWGVHVGDGVIGDCGKVGPFDTIDEAFSAAADAAIEHGATALPLDGFAQVKDSRGRGVGPIT